MVTAVPIGPLVGVKLLMTGGMVTIKSVALVADPPDVVTVIGPVVAPEGTLVLMVVEVTLVIVAWTPLKKTVEVGPKFVPVIVTPVPTGPLVGVKSEIVGGGGTLTVRRVLPLIEPDVAVMLVVPETTADATPAVSIVATDVLDEFQFTLAVMFWVVPSV
jgi:hypothetical protein